MRLNLALLLAALALVAAACGQGDDFWYDGDYSAATTLAKQNGSLVMVAFETDWCTWCDRLDRETFSDPEVRTALDGVVPLKLDAERGGKSLAARYGVESYPTIVFTDGDGGEVDRIRGYLPPGEFIAESRRIRGGDTILACLRRLTDDPADAEALETAVAGLLERSDVESAIERIRAFSIASGDDQGAVCDQLMLRARMALHSRLYRRAVALHLDQWAGELTAPDTDGTRRLRELLAGGFIELDPDARAQLLQHARHDDAAVVLAMSSPTELPPEDSYELADLAYGGGHYDAAAAAYAHWFKTVGPAADATDLHTAARQLYRSRRSLDLATVMARRAWELEPTSETADTLARLLYVAGKEDEAITLQRIAVDRADATAAADHREGLRRMEAGEDLDDRPGLEPSLGGVEPADPTIPAIS